MSTVDAELEVAQTPARAAGLELTDAREARVGDVAVRRLLPLRLRRSVGAWCFVDHYGPMSVDGVAGMRVPPHPHIGLQTVTWLISGNVLHRDSLGSEQMIRPGQLNLMTAGRGIAHAEESPAEHDPSLHGVQLWVALPDASRRTEPAFSHHADLPAVGIGGLTATVFVGSLGGARSPAPTFSEIVGAELAAARDGSARVPLAPAHEHVIFVATGSAGVEGTALRPGQLLYLAGPNTARCDRGGHPPAAPRCTCGFYAYGTRRAAAQYRETKRVLAVVACWGRIVPGTLGLRAQHARIEALWVSSRVNGGHVALVRRRYPSVELYASRRKMVRRHRLTRLDSYQRLPVLRRPRLVVPDWLENLGGCLVYIVFVLLFGLLFEGIAFLIHLAFRWLGHAI